MSKRKANEQITPEVIELSDSDDESNAKRSNLDTKLVCKYGSDCYRKNIDHLNEFEHPKSKSDVGNLDAKKEVQSKEDGLFKSYFYLTKVHNVRHSSKINEHYSISLAGIMVFPF
jgi:hypothetical protein